MGFLHRARRVCVTHPAIAQGLWLALGLALNAPGQAVNTAEYTDLLSLHGEWCAVVLCCAWLGPSPRTYRALGLSWCLLFLLEIIQVSGQLLTSADPLLYDLLFLIPHLWVLGFDLYPGKAWSGLLAILVVIPALVFAGSKLAGPILRSPHTTVVSGVFTVFVAGTTLLPNPRVARWVGPGWAANLTESVSIWRLTQSSIQTDAYRELRNTPPREQPDLELLIIESYGKVVHTAPQMQDRWRALLDDLEPELTQQGWYMASGWARASVSGGRSWISDASTLSGIQIRYESVWSHVQPHISQLTHLPGWLDQHGYETLVCRPKDRARMGLALRNDFGWRHTVFADDLDYRGPSFGWGGIPDQFSLGHVYEAVLPTLSPPRMVFFHGVSSHGPWKEPPPLVDDWRTLSSNESGGAIAELGFESSTNILKIQARRYGKKSKNIRRARRLKYPEYARSYLDVVEYTFRSMVATLPLHPGDNDRIVVIYGDHQPALLPPEGDFGVPVHILSTDKAWLAPFEAEGFTPGLHPSDQGVDFPLYALYPALARTLIGENAPELPRGVHLRTAMERTTAAP